MIDEIFKAVLKKHGPVVISVDDQGRYGIARKDDVVVKYHSFGLASSLIRLLVEDKK